MPIIFDEEEHAKEVLKRGTKTARNKTFELQIVANYLRDQGCDDKEIEKRLHKVAEKSFDDYNEVRFYKMIDKCVKKSKSGKLKIATPIKITQAEIDTILAEDNIKCEKLMFVYLVLAKYYMSNNKTEKYYVGCSDVDIFKLCDMYTTRKEKDKLLHYLTVKGYITPTLSMSSIVNYVNEESEVVFEFVPNETMVYYFEQKYLGGKFVKCVICGKLDKKMNNKQKYCKSCGLKVKNKVLLGRAYVQSTDPK